jgi:plastocyanin
MTRAIRSVLPVAVAGALSFGLAACSGSTSSKTASLGTTAAPATTAAPDTTAAPPTTAAPAPSTAAPTTAAPAAVTVHIHNLAFSPTPLQVKAGQTITIVNDDAVGHTFSADAGGFDSGIIAAGKSATITVGGSGSVGYHCNIHTFMKGVLQVTA